MTLAPPYPFRLERLDPGDLPGEVLERRKRAAAAAILAAMPLPLRTDEHAEAYDALLFPHDPPERARAMGAGMSSCALWALAFWRLLGVSAPELDMPYQVGHAVSDVVAIARRAYAWREPSELEPAPGVGDVLLLVAPEHVAVRAGPSAWVDGGQGFGGHTIARTTRALERFAGGWRAAHAGRRVLGWVDLPALPTPREAYVPEGLDLEK